MTVASLWKALDRAGCGKQIGTKELLDHHGTRSKMTPWNHSEMNKLSRSQKPVLAVDLSIWICEALACSAMRDTHVADPALQLVYSRALKLLTLGIKLVVVVEGKRRNRIRHNGGEENTANGNLSSKPATKDTFRKRRSGAPFWTACERCETMLKLLGVVVVRARAEGEALCALLNQRGIVDGVISNDGDCLLFGAKVLYTKFSIENLDRSKVLRYDASSIRVMVDDDDSDRFDETRLHLKGNQDVVELCRRDLIAFAILTGSDLAGEGLSKVGCRKAIRFIRKCQIDNPLKLERNSSPALEQLLSWGHTAASKGNLQLEEDVSGPRCSCCGHPGTKRDHKKYGCKGCGTKPGEACFQLSPGGRFRKHLRAKALDMQSTFDPSSTLRAYFEPNENQVPLCLVGKTAREIKMYSPEPEKLMELPFIIRGRSLQESREFVRKSLSAYLARQELSERMTSQDSATEGDAAFKLHRNRNRPTPVCVSKLMVRNGKPSCELKWIIKATTTDDRGSPLDEFEFSTIEDECVIQKCHPKLLQEFREKQKKMQQQGTAEQEKRRIFLLSMEKPRDGEVEGQKCQTRKNFFGKTDRLPKHLAKHNGPSDDVQAILIPVTKTKDIPKKNDKECGNTDVHIGRVIYTQINQLCENCNLKDNLKDKFCRQRKCAAWHEVSDDGSTIYTAKSVICDKNMNSPSPNEDYNSHSALTPGHEYFLGIESAFHFRCMADGDYRPRSNCADTKSFKERFVVSLESKMPSRKKTLLVRKDPISGKHGLKSMSITGGFFFESKEGNKAPCSESDYTKCEITKGLNENKLREVKKKLNFETEIEQKGVALAPLSNHHKDKVVKHNDHDNNYRLNDERAPMEGHNLKERFFVSNSDSSLPIHVAPESLANFDRGELHHRMGHKSTGNSFPFGSLIMQRADDQTPAKMLNFKCSNKFGRDHYPVGCHELVGTTREDDNGYQSNSEDFEYESYCCPSHKNVKYGRKRARDIPANICDYRIENDWKHWGIDHGNDESASCYDWQLDAEHCSRNFDKHGDVHKRRKISPSTFSRKQRKNSECPQHDKKESCFVIRNQVEDELECRESCCDCCKREVIRPDEHFIARLSRSCFADLSYPLNDASEVEYRKQGENARKARRDECVPVVVLDKDIDQPGIIRKAREDSTTCYPTSRRSYRQSYYNQSTSKQGISDLCSQIDGAKAERTKIERLIARKAVSGYRRARIRWMCSKFIEEEY